MIHDYSGCQEEGCDLCAAHGEGYSAGKAKALFEAAIATCHMSATPECRVLTMRGPEICHVHHG